MVRGFGTSLAIARLSQSTIKVTERPLKFQGGGPYKLDCPVGSNGAENPLRVPVIPVCF